MPPIMRRIVWLLAIAVAGLLVSIVILFVARSSEAAQQQKLINDTFCQVLAQLPAESPELSRIRGQLACKQAGLTPAQMKQLAKTGGNP